MEMKIVALLGELLVGLGGLLVGLCGGVSVGLSVRWGTDNTNLGLAAGMFTFFVVWPLFTIMFFTIIIMLQISI